MFAHFIDERGSVVIRKPQMEALQLEVERSVGGMRRRTRQTQTLFVLTAFKVEILHIGVSVSIIAIDTQALQSRCDETEVALQSHLHAQKVGIPRVDRLDNLVEIPEDTRGIFIFATDPLVHNKVVDPLVENTG